MVVYGKIKRGWQLAYLRRTNGIVALTPTLSDPWWMKIPIVLVWHNGKSSSRSMTTFTFGLKGYREQFG